LFSRSETGGGLSPLRTL